MSRYYVEAHTSHASIAEDIVAKDLRELRQYVKETFVALDGCRDTSEVDCSWVDFYYDYVEECDKDITDKARETNNGK